MLSVFFEDISLLEKFFSLEYIMGFLLSLASCRKSLYVGQFLIAEIWTENFFQSLLL